MPHAAAQRGQGLWTACERLVGGWGRLVLGCLLVTECPSSLSADERAGSSVARLAQGGTAPAEPAEPPERVYDDGEDAVDDIVIV